MFRLIPALLLCALVAPLAADEVEFKPIQISVSNGNIHPGQWFVTWDKPEVAPKQLEVWVFHTVWPIAPSIDEFCPKWKEFIFTDTFDADAFRKAGGPEASRTRIDVVADRAALGVMDHQEEYRIRNIYVLFIDAEGKRTLPKNMKAENEEAGILRNDFYYMPGYQPYTSITRLWNKKPPSKIEWEVPVLGKPYEIEKVLFIGAENSLNSYWIWRCGFDNWLAGKDENSKPMIQELKADAKACWVKETNFKFYWVIAVTKSGMRVPCKLKQEGTGPESQATAEEQKTLPAIELKKKE